MTPVGEPVATALDLRRALWTAALKDADEPDLRSSLVAELAEYRHEPADHVAARCAAAAAEVAAAWQAAGPTTTEAATAFYRDAGAYLYELTWWHALAEDESALVQVQALETARARACSAALDFGSGIGSLGVLLARHGLAVTLADVNPALNAYARWRFARRGLRAAVLDLNAGALPIEGFDFVAAVDVLEHLPDPRPAIAALAAALQPGGTLFINLPAEPDGLRPQHLAHDPDALLQQLAAAGLWLEQAAGPTLVLRRGAGPSYRLCAGYRLTADAAGPLLLSHRPLHILRLNAQAAAVLQSLDGSRTAAAVAAETGLAPARLLIFLDDLVERRVIARQPGPPAGWPSVSVIIPARNRAAQTRACVESLLALDYPADRLEIIVFDDASDPPLAETLAGLPVRLTASATNVGQSRARNLAAAHARGDLLAFLDNDCVAEPRWLRALVPYLSDPTFAIVGGRVLAACSSGPVASYESARSPLDMGAHGGEVAADGAVAYLPTCNLIVRRDVLQHVGGFDADMALGEDVDFIWRVRQAGWRAWYAPEGRVIHNHRVELRALLARRADYGSSEADLQRRHPHSRGVMVLPAAVLLAVAAVLAALAAAPIDWRLSAILGATAAAILVGEVAVKRRRLLGSGLGFAQVAAAVVREYAALAFHLGSLVMRYYSAPLVVAGLLWPPLLVPLAALAFIASYYGYRQHGLRMGLPVFAGLYGLEMLAYQAGVWRGCRRWRTLAPLRPPLRLRF